MGKLLWRRLVLKGFVCFVHIFEYYVASCNDYLLWHIFGFDAMMQRTSRSQNSVLENKEKKVI